MTTKTGCATCCKKQGISHLMSEAEARLHFDANPDHKAITEDEIVFALEKVRFVEWSKDESALQCRAWFSYRGRLYDANEALHMGLKLPEVPLCDL